MKKAIVTIFSFFAVFSLAFAGGIVTNTNQSAAWVRMMARDASTDVDAVFFNPAGLTHLEDGFYVQLNSQTVSQTRTITSTLSTLNEKEYIGETFVPFLPSAFLVYKKGNLAVSGGFTVIGGGGGAKFNKGLPSFEGQISSLPTSLAGLEAVGQAAGVDLAVSGYSADIFFEGSSAYFGFQGGVSYKINDMISVAVGARYVSATNTYTGHIKDISVITANGKVRADTYMTTMAVPTLNGVSANLTAVTGIPGSIQPLIDGGGGGLTIAQAQGLELITEEQAAGIGAGVTVVGGDPAVLTMSEISALITGATPALQEQIAQLDGTAAALTATAATLGDKEVDVKQTGTAFTPFFGADFSFMDGDLGLSIKYELASKMKVTNETTKDDTGLYPDKEEIPSDMPSMLSVGLRYGSESFRVQTGFHYYGDRAVQYGKKNEKGDYVTNGEDVTFDGKTEPYLAGNSYEVALGFEYDINEMFTLGAGYLLTSSNPNDIYQSDLSYSLKTNTIGFGGAVHLNEKFTIDLGFSTTSYKDYEKTFDGYKETYDKSAIIVAVGVSYGF